MLFSVWFNGQPWTNVAFHWSEFTLLWMLGTLPFSNIRNLQLTHAASFANHFILRVLAMWRFIDGHVSYHAATVRSICVSRVSQRSLNLGSYTGSFVTFSSEHAALWQPTYRHFGYDSWALNMTIIFLSSLKTFWWHHNDLNNIAVSFHEAFRPTPLLLLVQWHLCRIFDTICGPY